MRARFPSATLDGLVVVGILVGTASYIGSFPHHLGATDESLFLYEAKRIVEGEVMYRDFFEIVSPVAWYFMALLFRIFGTAMTTARIAMALIHGLIAVTIYLACRTAGVRRGLAVGAALVFVAICQPAWPFASPHWFSTLVSTVLLLILLRAHWVERMRAAVLLGAVSGIAVGIQQQKGVVLTTGVFVVLVADNVFGRRFSPVEPVARLVARIAAFGAGFIAVVVPLASALILAAGADQVFTALIAFPLNNYRQTFHSAWGGASVFSVSYVQFTYPTVLKLLPLILVVIVGRAAVDLVRGTNRSELRRLAVLAIWCVTSMLSIAYYPDFIHITFIAPVFLVAIAEGIEWGLQRMARVSRVARLAGATAAAVLITASVWQMYATRDRVRRLFPIGHETAFGRIDFANDTTIRVIDRTRELLEQTPGKELFCYPGLSSPYLLTGGKNPTPYQMLTPQYSNPSQLLEVVSILEAHKTPYVITAGLFTKNRSDPVLDYIRAHYTYVALGGGPAMWLFVRNDE